MSKEEIFESACKQAAAHLRNAEIDIESIAGMEATPETIIAVAQMAVQIYVADTVADKP